MLSLFFNISHNHFYYQTFLGEYIYIYIYIYIYVYIYIVLYYNRTEVSECMDVNKKSASNKYIIYL